MPSNSSIVGFGIACIDYIVVAPAASSGQRVDASEFCVQGGGMTGTSIVAAARLGAETKMLGRVGDDEVGREVLLDLRSEGVDASGLLLIPGAKSLVSIVIVDSNTAERTIYSRLDSDIDCPTDMIDFTPIREAKALLIDPHWKEGALRAVEEAKAAGVPVVCDVNNPVRHKDLLAMCDYPIISKAAALRLIESDNIHDALRAMRSFGCKTAIITCGADGAYYSSEEAEGHVPAFAINAIDTTGAGDVFHGAFAVALTQDLGLRECIVFASAVAAIKCTQIGGRAGIPSFQQTLDFLAERHLLPQFKTQNS